MLLGSSFLCGLLSLTNRNVSSTNLRKRLLKGWGGGQSQERAFATFRTALFYDGAQALLTGFPPALPSCRRSQLRGSYQLLGVAAAGRLNIKTDWQEV